MNSNFYRYFPGLLWALILLADTTVAAASEAGVRVEQVAADSVLARAGLEPGDVVLAWQSADGASGGEFETPFDWSRLVVDQAAQGPLLLTGRRAESPLRFEVEPGLWSARVGAVGEVPLWSAFAAARQQLSEDPAAAVEALRGLLAQASDPAAKAEICNALGDGEKLLGRFDDAAASYQLALEIRQSAWGDGLAVADSRTRLGILAQGRGQWPQAQELHAEALAGRRRLAPGSLAEASSLNNLAIVAFRRDQLERSIDLHRQALTLRSQWAPESRLVAASLINLGNALGRQGDLKSAAENYEVALELAEHRFSDDQIVAGALGNLGVMALRRGDMALSEDYFGRALALQRELDDGSLAVAGMLNNLGEVAVAQERPELASQRFTQALAIRRQLAPEGPDVAESLNSLGHAALASGDLAAAKTQHQQALAIRRRVAPESLLEAESWSALGLVAKTEGRLELARQHHSRAHQLRQQLAPGSVHEAFSLMELGMLAALGGDLEAADALYQEALAIWRELAPASAYEAESLAALGRLEQRRGRAGSAAELFQQAIDALEQQVVRVGGSFSGQERFRSRRSGVYGAAAKLEIEAGRPERAFALVERGRARTFLDLLAERELVFDRELPAELEGERRRLAVLYDRAQQSLWRAPAEQAAAARGKLAELRAQRDALVAKIRQVSPRVAALRYPQPLALDEVQELLDPGTVLLSFHVGPDWSGAFAVDRRRGLLRAVTLPVDADELRRRVAELRLLIQEAIPGSALGERRRASLERAAAGLWELLIGPFESEIEPAERLLILPDGPLHSLPFAALQQPAPGGPPRAGKYLIEWKPLHFGLSATIAGELVKSRRPPRQPATLPLVAFADPQFARLTGQAPPSDTEPRLRSALGGGLDWQPLPHTRSEAERVAGLYPRATLWLGEEATEEQAKSIDRSAQVVHFATHSHLDDRSPLDSALVLTVPEKPQPGRDNGLLQAWEIFEGVRFEVDLVVLSACQTALVDGRDGDGLVGLTQAFRYAGARSVVASLWSVADRSTPELMVRFHRHLRSGKSKDQALRAAQVELLRGGGLARGEKGDASTAASAAAFHWSAFQVYGDWR